MSSRRILILALLVAAAVPAAGSSAPATTPAPRVSNLVAPTAVSARQGHARFLVGIRTATTARVIARTIQVSTGKVVRTTKTSGLHAPGRVWLLVQANNALGFQLKAGKYRIEVYAVDATKRKSNVITRNFTLTLKAPRGLVQAYTVPAWPSVMAGVTTTPVGQIVAAVPPTSTLAKAGLARGDVIRSINGKVVDTRGAWFAALRQLPSGAIPLEFERAGVRQTIQFTPPPDWTTPPKFEPLLTEAVAAAPTVRAFQYARVRERIDAGQTATAQTLLGAWPVAEQDSAPGELLSGALAHAAKNYVGAAGAYNRALAADPTMAAAQFALGLTRSDNSQNDRAITAFQAARTLDPTDAIAPTFHAFTLLIADQFDPALQAADAAIALDPRYEEAYLARGLALIGLARIPEGVAALKRGLVLSSNAARAQQIITSSLEPNTP